MKVFYSTLFLIFSLIVNTQAQDTRNGNNESGSVKNPKRFASHGAIPNSQFYDNVTIEDLKNQEFKLGKDITFGGSVGTNLHLQNGSILFCRTNNGLWSNWAKLQIISFGKGDNTLPELYIRYKVWSFSFVKNGEQPYKQSEYEDLFDSNQPHIMNRVNLDFADWDFFWKIDEDELLRLNPIGTAKFYLVQPEDMVIKPKPVSIVPKPYKRQFPPDGKETNKELYYNMNMLAIESLEGKMSRHKLGAIDGTPLHCQKGSIIAYKTAFGKYGKFQILSFGEGENGLEMYLRYITYLPTGEAYKMNELVTVQDKGWVERFDVQKQRTKNFDKKWWTFWEKDSVFRTFTAGISVEIQNGLLFLTSSNLNWYLLESKQAIPITHASIRWTHNPISITSSKNIFISACVEIQDSLPTEAYTLYLNNKIVNNFSTRKSEVIRDCNSNNSFERNLELQEGRNEIKLVVKSKQGEMQQMLNVQYSPNYKRRLALTMGNKDYKQLRPLRNPIRDADSMAATLKSIGCDTLRLNNGTLSEMRAKLAEFKHKLKGYDIGIVFFAGHGEQKASVNYLMPIESDISLSLNDVFDALQDKIGVVFLDACRYEPKRASVQMDKQRTFTDVNNVKNNLYLFFASSSGTGASDGMSNHGLFTKHLLRHLKECTPFQTLIDNVILSVLTDKTENNDGEQKPSAKSIGEYQGIYLCD